MVASRRASFRCVASQNIQRRFTKLARLVHADTTRGCSLCASASIRKGEPRMSRFGKAKALFRAAMLTACGSLVLQPWSVGEALAGTATPIQHDVVIFQENVSFDHYFATYPVAANPSGEPAFFAGPR